MRFLWALVLAGCAAKGHLLTPEEVERWQIQPGVARVVNCQKGHCRKVLCTGWDTTATTCRLFDMSAEEEQSYLVRKKEGIQRLEYSLLPAEASAACGGGDLGACADEVSALYRKGDAEAFKSAWSRLCSKARVMCAVNDAIVSAWEPAKRAQASKFISFSTAVPERFGLPALSAEHTRVDIKIYPE